MGTSPLRWGILGTGNIAAKLAIAINESSSAVLQAVASREVSRAKDFADQHAAAQAYGSYHELLEDADIDAVYISLPNHLHAVWTIRCAEAGKHILCEKPFAVNYAESMVALDAVRRAGVFCMEAFMYRCHPLTARALEVIRAGRIGTVRMIQASFAFNMGLKLDNIRLSNACAGGGIMDVGCYAVSMSRLLAGAALGLDGPAEPTAVTGHAHIGEQSRVDEWAAGVLRFDDDLIAQVACGTQVGMTNDVRVFGSEGNLRIEVPWFAKGPLTVHRNGEEPEVIEVTIDSSLYANEIEVMAEHIAAGKTQVEAPAMSWDDTLGNMQVLDAWRGAIDLCFEAESEIALSQPVARRPLRPRPDHTMKYGEVAGIDKPVSRLVMGSMIYKPEIMPFTCAMLDNFVEIGGNCIDSSLIYMGGKSEVAIGEWLQLRGNREEMVLLTKGAVPSPDFCTPEWVDKHIAISLERLQTDYIDLWMMHRDNPQIPIGEFVDCLNRQIEAGRIRAYGGSNFTLARLQEANDYAAANGLRGYAANNPNLALARWNEPVWEGCITASDAESRRWHTQTQLPLFAWSSQAQGFFTGRDSAEETSDANMVRCWYNADNFQRLERARDLAKQKGVTATQIAMAWVLNQPFPTFALMGPRTLEETRTSALGLTVTLTPDELAWLNLEA